MESQFSDYIVAKYVIIAACLIQLSFATCNVTISIDENPEGTLNLTGESQHRACKWTLTFSKHSSPLYITFERVSMNEDDSMVLNDGMANVGTNQLSGPQGTFIWVVWTQATILFKPGSDPDNRLNVVVKYSNSSGCNLMLNGPVVDIQAPISHNGTTMWRKSITCWYNYSTSDTNQRASLQFEQIKFYNGNLIIYDGVAEQENILVQYKDGEMFNTQLDDVVTKSSGNLLVNLTIPSKFADTQTMYAVMKSVQADCNERIQMTDLNEAMTIQSPNYPYKYNNMADCSYLIVAPRHMNALLKVTVNDLDLADEFDQLSFHNGGNKMANNLATLSGNTKLTGGEVYMTSQSKLWIHFSSDSSKTAKGFSLNITAIEFGGLFMNASNVGEIHFSASVNGTVPDQIFYHIIVDEKYQVYLEPSNVSPNSPISTVTVFDGCSQTDSKLAVFTSATEFYNIASSGNNMLVVLDNYTGRGIFSAGYAGVPADNVPMKLITTAYGGLSMNAPFADYVWLLKTNKHTGYINLKLHDLVLMPNDTLTVYNGLSNTWGRLAVITSQETLPLPPIHIQLTDFTSHIRIEYHTGIVFSLVVPQHTEVRGQRSEVTSHFQKITAVFNWMGACDNSLSINQSQGATVTSPDYPDRYPLNSQCQWLFASPTKLLYVNFELFELANQHTLSWFKVYGSNTEYIGQLNSGDKSPGISDFVVDITPKKPTNDSVKFMVKFDGGIEANNSLIVGKGFLANISSLDCGGMMYGLNMTISTPKTITRSTVCVWVVIIPPRAGTNLTNVNILQLNYNSSHQIGLQNTRNYLEVRDGGRYNSPLMSLTNSSAILTRTNYLWVKYVFEKINVNSTETGFTFKLQYSNYTCSPEQQCNNSICLHPSWRCDGVDQCGDMTDEVGCIQKLEAESKGKISKLAFGLAVGGIFLLGVILALGVPYCYRRWRYPNYSRLQDLMTPVNT